MIFIYFFQNSLILKIRYFYPKMQQKKIFQHLVLCLVVTLICGLVSYWLFDRIVMSKINPFGERMAESSYSFSEDEESTEENIEETLKIFQNLEENNTI